MSAGTAGLADVIAGQTAICTVGHQGNNLHYRGYSIFDLTEQATFEEVAYLLIYGSLPTLPQYQQFIDKLNRYKGLPQAITDLLSKTPSDCHPMDVLRTICSVLGTLEPESAQHSLEEIACRLMMVLPSALMWWYHFHLSGQTIQVDIESSSIAEYFLKLLLGKNYQYSELTKQSIKAVDVSFMLYAEHEFNASTFSARVCAATLSDVYSAVTAAIGTLKGPLHGGANEAALSLIQSFNTPAEVEAAILKKLELKEKIMGFGHRVYKEHDPRSDLIKLQATILSKSLNDDHMLEIAENIEKTMRDQKNLFPNLDFYSACAYHFCKIPAQFFTPLFVMSRLTGWIAHIKEQRQNNKLIRPSAEYIGPKPQKFVAMNKR